MPQAIPIVLGLWIPVTLVLFWVLPPRRAVVAALLGGWLLLPTARYDDDVKLVEFPYWILPVSQPSPPWWTKAVAIPLAALLGVLLFDRKSFRRLRLGWWDLPMVGWIVWPLVSTLANEELYWNELALVVGYQAIAWGIPYALGRIYFADSSGRDDLAFGIVLGGLLYAVPCMVESVIGPWLYADLYGFHPYRSQGAVRYVGYRPIVFMEDGNQLGTWLATSALTAVILWRSGRLRRFLGIHGVWVAGGLVALAVASQSVGAVLLLVLGLGAFEVVRWSGKIWPLLVPLALVVVLLGVRAVNLVDAKALAKKTTLGQSVIKALDRVDRHSLGWRIKVEETAMKIALERPITGFGQADWWRSGQERPWGLLGLALGMFGLPGWALLLGCLAVPVARFLVVVRPAQWETISMASATALAAVLTLNALDSILNAAYIMPLVAAAGGLARISPPPRPDSSMGHLVVRVGR